MIFVHSLLPIAQKVGEQICQKLGAMSIEAWVRRKVLNVEICSNNAGRKSGKARIFEGENILRQIIFHLEYPWAKIV